MQPKPSNRRAEAFDIIYVRVTPLKSGGVKISPAHVDEACQHLLRSDLSIKGKVYKVQPHFLINLFGIFSDLKVCKVCTGDHANTKPRPECPLCHHKHWPTQFCAGKDCPCSSIRAPSAAEVDEPED